MADPGFFLAILKGQPGQFFHCKLSSCDPQSWFVGHWAESTREHCMIGYS